MKNILSFVMEKVINPIKEKYWMWQYRNYDPNETYGMKHIWGLKSWDDLTGAECNFHTMNDIDITYHEDTDEYSIGIETMYMFKNENGDREYVQKLLDRLTEWMVEKGYSTDNKLWLYGVFSEGYNINKRFKTIPELYANFKMLVNGYCSL